MTSSADRSARNRAKVYQLNNVGQWDDRGTGYAACQYLQGYGFACIILVNEEDSTPILETRVSPEDIYQRQGETIISWTEPQNGCDVALSFADAAGCTDLWEQICTLQRAELQAGGWHDGEGDDDGPSHLGGLLSLGDRDGFDGPMGAENHPALGHEVAVQLPAPELRNVRALADALGEITFYQRPTVVQMILQQDYVPRLARLFSTVEDLEDIEGLHAMFHTFRTLVMLNDTGVFEQLLRDDVIMATIGALEYDPELRAHDTRHREFLQNVAEFKEVLPLRDPAIVAKVHQNFRVQYIKDVVLPRSLDDNTFATLNSIMFMNNVAILGHIQNDTEYLSSLFTQLHDEQLPIERRRDLSRLLLELCQLARNLQLFNRASFYRRLMDFGLFTPIASLIMSGDPALQLNAAEVLGATCLHDPSMLRQYVLVERPERRTIGALMHALTVGAEAGVKAQLSEVLRALLDPETMEGVEQEEFLNLFYEHFILGALAPLESAGRPAVDAGTQASQRATAGRGAGAYKLRAHNGDTADAAPADEHEPSVSAAPVASASTLVAAGSRSAAAEASAALGATHEGVTGGSTGGDGGGSGGVDDALASAAAQTAADTGAASGNASGGSAADARVADADANGDTSLGSGEEAAALDDDVDDEALSDVADGCGAHEIEEAVHASRLLVVELLCFCVNNHGYRIKYFVLKNHVIPKVLRLCQLRDKPLILAAVRFMRACIGLKDEFYNKYVVKNDCLAPLVEQLVANARLDNLLASAVIELLDFIRKENVKSLVAHLHDVHREQLESARQPRVVRGLWMRHEQNLELARTVATRDGGVPAGACACAGGGEGVPGKLPPRATLCAASSAAAAAHARAALDARAVAAAAADGAAGMLGANPGRAPRRAPLSGAGLRAFPDEDDEDAYFEGSDEEEAAGDENSNSLGGIAGAPGDEPAALRRVARARDGAARAMAEPLAEAAVFGHGTLVPRPELGAAAPGAGGGSSIDGPVLAAGTAFDAADIGPTALRPRGLGPAGAGTGGGVPVSSAAAGASSAAADGAARQSAHERANLAVSAALSGMGVEAGAHAGAQGSPHLAVLPACAPPPRAGSPRSPRSSPRSPNPAVSPPRSPSRSAHLTQSAAPHSMHIPRTSALDGATMKREAAAVATWALGADGPLPPPAHGADATAAAAGAAPAAGGPAAGAGPFPVGGKRPRGPDNQSSPLAQRPLVACTGTEAPGALAAGAEPAPTAAAAAAGLAVRKADEPAQPPPPAVGEAGAANADAPVQPRRASSEAS